MYETRTILNPGGSAKASTTMESPIERVQGSATPRATSARREKTLVVVTLRGGMDGLMAVPPVEDEGMEALRPGIAMGLDEGLLDLGNGFAMHPALAELETLYRQGLLAVVHGVGTSRAARTHAEAEEALDTHDLRNDGTPGWIGRAAAMLEDGGDPCRTTSISLATPLEEAFTSLADQIKSDSGLDIGFVESDGWDTHAEQGSRRGAFADRAAELSRAVAAFWSNLGEHSKDVVLLVLTEFGRTVTENASGGTDHGRGSCWFVIGDALRGGRVYGSIPLLREANLENRHDLPVTTDARAVFAALVRDHLGIANPTDLFPAWTGKPLDMFRDQSAR